MTTTNDHRAMHEGAQPVPSAAIGSGGGAGQPPPRPRGRLTFFQLGCLVVVALVGAYLAFLVVLAQSFRECFPPRAIHRDAPMAVVSLDSAHPVAVQRVHVALSKDAIGSSAGPAAARLQVGPPSPAQPAPASSPSPRPATQPALLVSFVDDATGRTLPAVRHDDLGAGVLLAERPHELIVDCQPGAACAQDIRIVIALAHPELASRPVEVRWVAGVDVALGSIGCAGPPSDAAAIQAAPATVMAAADLARSTAEEVATDATLAVRAVTVSSGSAPATAWLRVSLARTSSFWLPWLLVLPDDGGPAVFEGVVGRPFQGTREAVDVPILTSCTIGRPCSARYWVVVRGIPLSGAYDTTWSKPEGFGVARLGIAAFALGRGGGDARGVDIAVNVAAEGRDIAQEPVALTDELAAPLEADAPRAFDVHIHVPQRAADPTSPDPRLTGYVVVRVFVPSTGIGARLEGDGALPMPAAVGGFSSLAAAPFASCPALGPCDLHLRVVAEYVSSPSSRIISPKPAIAARAYIVGGPAGVTATVDPVKDLPHPATGLLGALQVPIVVAVIAASVAALAIIVRRRRRAARRPAAESRAPRD